MALLTVAVTATVPATPAGAFIVHDVLLAHMTEVAFAVANLKTVAVAPGAKPAPETLTGVPAAVGPELGETASTIGVNVKRSLLDTALVAALFVTVTSTLPGAPGGESAVIEVCELTV